MGKIPDLAAIRDWCKSMFQPRGNYAAASDVPTRTSQLTNDSGYFTEMPVATESSIGGVKVDGTTITIDADGVIHAVSKQTTQTTIISGETQP